MFTQEEIEQLQCVFVPMFERIDEKFAQIDEKFDRIDEKFERIDEKFTRIDEKFARIDGRFEQMEQRFDKIEGCLVELGESLEEVRCTTNVLVKWAERTAKVVKIAF